MPKAFHGFLLCSVLSVPFLGSSSAHAATFVNFEGGCLTDQLSDTADGNPILVFQCLNSPFQQWKWEGRAIQGIGTSEVVGKCITRTGVEAEGTPVQLFQCNGTGAQQWFFKNGRIMSPFNGRCLDVGDGSNFTQATIRTCNFAIAATGQRWLIR